MPSRYQDGAATSHGFGTQDRRAYQDGAARSHGYGTSDRTADPSCIQGIRTRLQDLTGSEQKIQHAYKVLGRDCSISQVRNIRRTCLRAITVGLHDLTGKERQFHMHMRYQDGAA